LKAMDVNNQTANTMGSPLQFKSLHLLIAACLGFIPQALRAQAKPLAQDYSIVWHNTDREFYVEGPGLARMVL